MGLREAAIWNFFFLMLEKGARLLAKSVYHAFRGGHMEIIHFLTKCEHWSVCWDTALCNAAARDHMDAVLLAIKNGARDWNLGLSHAAKNGRMDMVIFMIKKGAICWRDALCGAVHNHHMDVALLIFEHFRDVVNWEEELSRARKNKQEQLILFLEHELGLLNSGSGTQ